MIAKSLCLKGKYTVQYWLVDCFSEDFARLLYEISTVLPTNSIIIEWVGCTVIRFFISWLFKRLGMKRLSRWYLLRRRYPTGCTRAVAKGYAKKIRISKKLRKNRKENSLKVRGKSKSVSSKFGRKQGYIRNGYHVILGKVGRRSSKWVRSKNKDCRTF